MAEDTPLTTAPETDKLQKLIDDMVSELGRLEFNHREQVRGYEARKSELVDQIRTLVRSSR